MNAITLMLVLDGMLILLLGVTVVYCLKLNLRIRVLQDSKAEFAKLIERFDSTTQRAQQSIEDLQNISKKVNEQLSGRLDKANFLADDLAFMIEKGSKLADKMEGRVTQRPGVTAAASATIADIKSSVANTAPAERRGGASGPALREVLAGDSAATDRKRASLEAMLNRANSRNSGAAESGEENPRRRPMASARLRSKAEQELFDALKSGGKS